MQQQSYSFEPMGMIMQMKVVFKMLEAKYNLQYIIVLTFIMFENALIKFDIVVVFHTSNSLVFI